MTTINERDIGPNELAFISSDSSDRLHARNGRVSRVVSDEENNTNCLVTLGENIRELQQRMMEQAEPLETVLR